MPSTIYYVVAGICASLGLIGTALFWLMSLVYRTGRLIRGMEMNQALLEQKVTGLLNLFSKLEDHSIRLAIVETKMETFQTQNGRQEDCQ